MRRQHELERDTSLELRLRDAVELGESVRERLGRNALLPLVLEAPAHAVLLFRDVRELEVEREGAQDTRLALDRERRDALEQLVVRRPRTGGAREGADALDVLEQRLVLLLDEHAAEQIAEQADVAPKGRVGGGLLVNDHAV